MHLWQDFRHRGWGKVTLMKNADLCLWTRKSHNDFKLRKMGLLRISQTIFSTIGEICKLAIKVVVRNYRNGIVGEIGDFKSNSDPTAWIAPYPAIGRASHSPNTKKLPNSTKKEIKCSCKFRTFDETRACELATKERTQKIIAPRNCMCPIMSKQGGTAGALSDAPKKNCSIIQRICATHSIKLTDPLKSRIKIVAIKSSEHQHKRNIQMMGGDQSSGESGRKLLCQTSAMFSRIQYLLQLTHYLNSPFPLIPSNSNDFIEQSPI